MIDLRKRKKVLTRCPPRCNIVIYMGFLILTILLVVINQPTNIKQNLILDSGLPYKNPIVYIESNNILELFPIHLVGSYSEKKETIERYLKSKGEIEIATWIRIFTTESNLDELSEAPTYWSLCDRKVSVRLWGVQQQPANFIELKDYEGRIWQTTCEEYGAITKRIGVSKGLSHIIETTWELLNCKGDRLNWADNIDCAIKIRNLQGWEAWASY